jgi:hypothetical protein
MVCSLAFLSAGIMGEGFPFQKLNTMKLKKAKVGSFRELYHNEYVAAVGLRMDICWLIGLHRRDNPALVSELEEALAKHNAKREEGGLA